MKFINLLKKLSTFSDHHQHKMSCILARGNKIISAGYNKIKTHPAAKNRFHMLHAEVSALLSIPYEETRGCTAYIYRQQKDGTLALARPCEACYEALKLSGIKRIIYTDSNSWKEEYVI